jgi:hypothetical protein
MLDRILIESVYLCLLQASSPILNMSQCPVCHGAGMCYLEGFGKGGAKQWQHERLTMLP